MAFLCPQSTVDKLEKEKMPRKGGRWWFSWRRRDFPAKEVGDHGPRAGPGWAAGRSSLDGYSPHSPAPRGRKPQCGSSGGKSGLVAGALQLEQELGRMAAGGGWSQHPSPAVGLCHSSITSTPLLFPGTCPHFTDGKTYIHQRSQSQEVAELEGVPRKLARTRGYLMKEWGIPSPPGAG